jgi:hypothetical protein
MHVRIRDYVVQLRGNVFPAATLRKLHSRKDTFNVTKGCTLCPGLSTQHGSSNGACRMYCCHLLGQKHLRRGDDEVRLNYEPRLLERRDMLVQGYWASCLVPAT